MTMVAIPGNDARLHPDRPVRRLIGTAVVLSPHRLLTTASMAIPGGLFSVLVGDGLKRRAELRGVDRQSNVALFSVEGAPLPPLRQASPQSIAPGSWVAVISNVNVTRPQITLGQVAARGERVDFPYSGDIVEIEATTAPGASGGAVLNEAGDWVAIVVGRAGKEPPRAAAPVVQPGDPGAAQQPADLLIALPVDQLQRIADDLEQYGSVRHAFLGIQGKALTSSSQADYIPTASARSWTASFPRARRRRRASSRGTGSSPSRETSSTPRRRSRRSWARSGPGTRSR